MSWPIVVYGATLVVCRIVTFTQGFIYLRYTELFAYIEVEALGLIARVADGAL